jgi:hypothetical protein
LKHLFEAVSLFLPEMDTAAFRLHRFLSDIAGLDVPLNVEAQPNQDDMDLQEMGGHRTLFNYLSTQMGISVQQGRGLVWYRAKRLVEMYENTFERNG